jgi:hypothetical protein
MATLTRWVPPLTNLILPVVVFRYCNSRRWYGIIMAQKQRKSPIWARLLGGVEDGARGLARLRKPVPCTIVSRDALSQHGKDYRLTSLMYHCCVLGSV